MLLTDLAAALRQEVDSRGGLRVGWEAVADGNLLALLHRDAADECQWGALVPRLTGRQTYMATPPKGHLCPAWADLIAAFHDHGILPDDKWKEVWQKTLGRDYRRRVHACLLELRDPLRQRWDDLWLHVRPAHVARVRALTATRRRALQSPQHHASPTGGRAGARQSPMPSARGGRLGPGGERSKRGARGTRCCPARPGGQREGFPSARPPSSKKKCFSNALGYTLVV